MRLPRSLLILTLVACSPNSDRAPVTGTTDPTPPTTTGTTTGGTTPSGVLDCDGISDEPVEVTIVPGPRAGRGLTFNQAGDLLIGAYEPHITQSTYDGPMALLRPDFGNMEQIDRLPNGDYVVARFDSQTLVRVTPDGAESIIAANIPTYVVRVGPDGMIYNTTGEAGPNSVVQRTDPETGTTEVVVRGIDGTPPFQPRVLDFSPDLSRLYIGTYTSGSIYVVDLDVDLNPTSDPVVLAPSVGNWHDGLGVDACGYLWVASYDDRATYRVSPDGSEVTPMLQSEMGLMWGHGIYWGSGHGGFLEDALYLPLPNNDDKVGEARIGMPYRTWGGTVINDR